MTMHIGSLGEQYAPQFTGEHPPALGFYGTSFAPQQQPGPAYSPSKAPTVVSELGLAGDTDFGAMTFVGYAAGVYGAYQGYQLTEELPTWQRVAAGAVGFVGAAALGTFVGILVRNATGG